MGDSDSSIKNVITCFYSLSRFFLADMYFVYCAQRCIPAWFNALTINNQEKLSGSRKIPNGQGKRSSSLQMFINVHQFKLYN